MRTKPLLSLRVAAIGTAGLSLSMALSLSSCGGDPGGPACTALYAYGLTVSVRDDVTNTPICDAMVTATDGPYTEVLQSQSAGGGDCAYVGAGERAGSYTITAKKSGYMDTTQNATALADVCHVKGVAVTMRLRR